MAAKKKVDPVARAERFVAVNRNDGTSMGLIADEILGPVLEELGRLKRENRRLRDLVQECLDEFASAADADTPLMQDLRKELKS